MGDTNPRTASREPSTVPELIGPQPQLLPSGLALAGGVVVVAAAVALWLAVGPDLNAGGGRAALPTITMAEKDVPGSVKPVASSLVFQGSPAWTMLALPDSQKRRIMQEMADGKLRLGALFLWDTIDEDTDTVRVSGAGYDQDVVITHAHRMVYVPYYPGTRVTITALRDGGGGGVTLGLSTIIGPVALPHLGAGQTLEIPVL